MEFGKVDQSKLYDLDWTIPSTKQYFSPAHLLKSSICLGSPAWGVPHFYPPKTSSKHYLYHYSRLFDCIELNTSFYRIPSLANVAEWKDQIPTTFKFCPKVPKFISHDALGLLDKNLHRTFYQFLQNLGAHLAPCFLQFHEAFSYEQKHLLFRFLESWDQNFPLALEFRHPSWFQNSEVLPALCEYLAKKKIGLVITDVAGRRDVLHSSITAPWILIRLIGNDMHPTDRQRLQQWYNHLQALPADTYLFLHQPNDVKTLSFLSSARALFFNQSEISAQVSEQQAFVF